MDFSSLREWLLLADSRLKVAVADLWSGSLLFLQGHLASSILIYALFVLGRFSGERLGKDRTCLLHINMAGTGIDKRSISKRRLLGLALPDRPPPDARRPAHRRATLRW